MHINASTDGSVVTASPVALAPAATAGSASEASSGWKRFSSTVEAILFYGILAFGVALPFVAFVVKVVQG